MRLPKGLIPRNQQGNCQVISTRLFTLSPADSQKGSHGLLSQVWEDSLVGGVLGPLSQPNLGFLSFI